MDKTSLSTAASSASDAIAIASHRGEYRVEFAQGALAAAARSVTPAQHFLVDARVAELYADVLQPILRHRSVLLIEASEEAKRLDRFTAYVEHLAAAGVRRTHSLEAIGGGVLQDITCFLAATLLRGLPWTFYPTTLLAQADSCIGSKSSINVGRWKNLLGTFTPPARIVIDTAVLATLDPVDVRSGIGEMLKVHAVAGPGAFDEIARDYRALLEDDATLRAYIRRSLGFKKRLIELDEFDRGPRNVMNYGHTFGHAIEAATAYGIPHGIAITIGMDMANHVASRLSIGTAAHFDRMHPVLRANYTGFERTPIPFEAFQAAMARDKKHTDAELTLILPGPDGRVAITRVPGDTRFTEACLEYFSAVLPA